MTFRVFGLPLRLPRRPRPVPPPGRDAASLAALPEPELLAALGTSRDGLTNHEAALRYRAAGPNTVAEDRPVRPWALLARLAVDRLSLLRRALVHTRVTVLRRPRAADGTGFAAAHPVSVPVVHVVPGDVVRLAAGDLVPADVRVLAAKDLFVDQATLTGESLPVEKTAAVAAGGSPLDTPCLAFMGTHVTSGTATAVVLATGAQTHFGALAREAAAARPATSFDAGIRRYLWLIIRFMCVMVPAVLLINGLTKGSWGEAFLFAVAVAAGMTPELLPMVITINLAKGALAMSRKRVIVKRLPAIQDFGAMDVLCTDKTGTLTQDRVLLERHVDIAGAESRRVLEFACLNSRFQSGLPNLLDEAVLTHADLHEHLKAGVGYAKVDEIPFDFERRRMSVVVSRDADGAHLLICKGAVEEVFAACDRAERDGAAVPLAPGDADALRAVTGELNDDGFRVIAVAYRELPPGPATYGVADEAGLVLLGYIAFLDPPKETAAEALRQLRDSGVAVKVLTGDNERVTRHVCRQVGLEVDGVLNGSEVDAMADAELARRAEAATVLAKLTPTQKERVIRALRAGGHVVGYLGDGINDVPALRAADAGVSVDSGVDVAKDSADIILLEKNLAVLREGVVEGRKVFGNVVKYVRMAGSSNFGNMFSMIGASALLPFLPMAPVQVLVNNLLYDVSQTAVATDDVDAEFLARPRRWDISGVGRYMACIGPLSSLFDYATFAVLVWGFDALADSALFQTGWFVESLLSQTLIVHVIRTGRVPFVESRPSRTLLAMTLAICAVGVALPFSPFAPALGLVPLPAAYFGALALLLAGYLALTQAVKTWVVRRFRLE